jgi:YVTN family beta-propeller protein
MSWTDGWPTEVAITHTGSDAYVTANSASKVKMINISTNAVVGTVSVGLDPLGVAIN